MTKTRRTVDSSSILKSPRLTIGIDFGTATCAVCWHFQAKSTKVAGPPRRDDILMKINRIGRWPGLQAESVPTELSYVTPNLKWGGQIKEAFTTGELVDDASVVRQIKLWLHPCDLTRAARDRLERQGKAKLANPDTFIVDFLKKVLQNTNLEIKKQMPSLPPKTTTCYTLAVPPAWTEHEQEAFMGLAFKAGIKDATLVSEPEAVTAYTMAKAPLTTLKIGTGFIVCDIGGGTVDLAAYQLCAEEPLQLKELAIPTGLMYGGSLLTDRLCDLVNDILRGSNLRHMNHISRVVRNAVEEQKYVFDGISSERPFWKLFIRGLPGDPKAGVVPGELRLPVQKVKDVFDEFLEKIIHGIADQLTHSNASCGLKPKTIILTGGGGKNEYIFRQLKDKFPNMNVLEPSYESTAVSSGCVLLQQNPGLIAERRSAKSYGVDYRDFYDPEVYGDEDTALPMRDPVEPSDTIVDTIKWILKKGDPICLGTVAHIPVRRVIELNDPWVFYDEIWESTDHQPTFYSFRHTMSRMNLVYKLKSDLRNISREKFPIKKTEVGGSQYYEINYDIYAEVSEFRLQPVLKFKSVVQGPGGPCFEVECIKEIASDDKGYKNAGSLVSRHFANPIYDRKEQAPVTPSPSSSANPKLNTMRDDELKKGDSEGDPLGDLLRDSSPRKRQSKRRRLYSD